MPGGGLLMLAGVLALLAVVVLTPGDDGDFYSALARMPLERILLMRSLVISGVGALLVGAAMWGINP